MWGNLLEKNIATFRCYGNISRAKYYVSPHPFQELSHKIYNDNKADTVGIRFTFILFPMNPNQKPIEDCIL